MNPKLYAFVNKPIVVSDIYKKTKDSTSLTTGFMQPLPVAILRFTSWSMNFVTNFTLSQGYNAIFMYVDCLTKYNKFILYFMIKNS